MQCHIRAANREPCAEKPFGVPGYHGADSGSLSDVCVELWEPKTLFITIDDNLIPVVWIPPPLLLATCPDSLMLSAYLCNLSHCWQ